MKKGFWNIFNNEEQISSADMATERLKVIVASEGRLHNRLTPDRIEKMKREILSVVNTYVSGVRIDDVNLYHPTHTKGEQQRANAQCAAQSPTNGTHHNFNAGSHHTDTPACSLANTNH